MMSSSDKGVELAMMHYEALNRFLQPHMDQIRLPTNSAQRASAREKLLRLTKTQFAELSTDVFDELLRRERNSKSEPFLAVNPLYHQKRNQARQKLATLPTNRFRDLASDVYFEIKRRFPEDTGNDGFENEDRKLEQQQKQERMISPHAESAKGFLGSTNSPLASSEDGPGNFMSLDHQMGSGPVEGGPRVSRPSQSSQQQQSSYYSAPLTAGSSSSTGIVSPLGSLPGPPSLKSPTQPAPPPIEHIEEKLRAQYEGTIKSLRSQVSDLESQVKELSGLKDHIADLEEKLTRSEQERNIIDEDFRNLQDEYEKLQSDMRALQMDFAEQEQVANDIRTEATNLLEEIKNLTTKNDELRIQKDRDQDTIQSLQSEVSRLKAELAMSQSLRRLGTNHSISSTASNTIPHSASTSTVRGTANSTKKRDPNIDFERDGIAPGGVISVDRFQAYQNAVQELLNAVRSETHANILVSMKSIVLACKSITEDVEAFEHDGSARLSEAEQQNVRDATNQLSGALTQQMSLAKELATRFDPSSVPAFENATADLTSAVLELSRALKPSSGAGSSRPSKKESSDTMERLNTYELDELKVYLEKQTDLIVQAIQTLLQSMRQSNSYGADFKETVDGITRIVDSLVRVSRKALSKTQTPHIQQQGDAILQDLSSANLRLDELGSSMMMNPQSKTLKQKLASSSYEIAKYVKELISLIE